MNCISKNQLNLMIEMRTLWEQHVFWTRLLIISILEDLKDLQQTENRLLRNPIDIGNVYEKFYSTAIQKTVTDLLREHLVIGADLVTAYKNNNQAAINRLNTLWYDNADRMAKAFASFNHCYNEEEIRKMLYIHLDLTKNEVALRLQKNFAEDVKNFDKIEKEAIEMADYFSKGIVCQFKHMFKCY